MSKMGSVNGGFGQGTSRFGDSKMVRGSLDRETNKESSPAVKDNMLSTVNELPRIGTGSMTVKTQPAPGSRG